jgi:acetoin utilization deacetylase AcuC-like enzyme
MAGHHAGPHHYGGYCFVNNAAIAARLLEAQGERVAVLDLDYHGGDGTFKFGLPRFRSLHTRGDYPYLDMGPDHGVELEPGLSWGDYEPALRRAVAPWTGEVDTVLLSLGFDTLEGDPDARRGYGQRLHPGDFRRMAVVLVGALVGTRLLVLQEGGYKMEDIGAAAAAFMEGCAAGPRAGPAGLPPCT